MAADQYCLKWNNHQSTLLVQFETLLESDSLTDCTLSAEGKYLNVHKVLLSACSPYFSKLLGEHKDKHPIFFMKDVAFEELKGIVEYMYKGEVNVMQERLDSFLKTASSLQIKGLADQDGGKGDEREEDPGGGRGKRKQAPDLRGGYGESSPMPEEPPRSPKRRRRPRPVSQDDSLPAQDQNHCDTTTAPPSTAYQQDVVMPTPLVPVKKTEPVDNSMVHLKTEIPDDVPQVDVQDLTLDDDEDFNNEDITQPGTSFSETSQDFAQWQQQMATQSGADESFIAATQGINQSAGSQGESKPKKQTNQKRTSRKMKKTKQEQLIRDTVTGRYQCFCGRSYKSKYKLAEHKTWMGHFKCDYCCFISTKSKIMIKHLAEKHQKIVSCVEMMRLEPDNNKPTKRPLRKLSRKKGALKPEAGKMRCRPLNELLQNPSVEPIIKPTVSDLSLVVRPTTRNSLRRNNTEILPNDSNLTSFLSDDPINGCSDKTIASNDNVPFEPFIKQLSSMGFAKKPIEIIENKNNKQIRGLLTINNQVTGNDNENKRAFHRRRSLSPMSERSKSDADHSDKRRHCRSKCLAKMNRKSKGNILDVSSKNNTIMVRDFNVSSSESNSNNNDIITNTFLSLCDTSSMRLNEAVVILEKVNLPERLSKSCSSDDENN